MKITHINFGFVQVSKKYVSKEIAQQMREKAKPFIDWLEQASEEEEDDDEEGEEEEVGVDRLLNLIWSTESCGFFFFVLVYITSISAPLSHFLGYWPFLSHAILDQFQSWGGLFGLTR